ncbi:S-DNA-T family DNA segregation ATPase FtsK/SpoIIIE [Bacillus ectoiniformans]|uniref:type VII secretion protein EssC n=1 Tax=Bacillus ectoiniformans TaxID=1494429 RepID=UPI00195C87C0|nr:type VII secretion protein EssC [Bacillus ectoiniformans]MBM7649222.1 S-DNA-T family DNA segregation ATPase FtsK/SpoIIIE [Bacillus ectoiniformans]
MSRLWIYDQQTFEHICLRDKERLTIGRDSKKHITLSHLTAAGIEVELLQSAAQGSWDIYVGEEKAGEIHPDEGFTIERGAYQLHLFLEAETFPVSYYYCGNQQNISLVKEQGRYVISKKEEPDSASVCRLVFINNEWSVIPKQKTAVYVNGLSISGVTALKTGDYVQLPFLELQIAEADVLAVYSPDQIHTDLPEMTLPSSDTKMKYPDFRRIPRMMYELPKNKVTFSFPTQEHDNQSRGLWLMILPPLMMLLVMGIIAIIQPRGLFLLISVVMFATTLVTSTVQYFKDKKQRKESKEKRHRIYTNYLEQKRHELQDLSEEQSRILYYHYPSFEKMKEMTEKVDGRIWEKTFDSPDFLSVRIGRSDIPASYEIMSGTQDLANREMDQLLEESQEIADYYSLVRNVPLSADLSDGSIGLIGKEKVVKSEIRQWIGQLAFFQSYHDVRFVAIFHEEEYQEWEWVKWLPHFQLPHSYAKGLVYNEETRDQLLSSIYEVLRERDLDEEKDKKKFAPHYVFFVTNRQLISEHAILEYLEGGKLGLGITSIFTAETKESLFEHIHTLIRYVNEQEGEILIEQGKAVRQPFRLDPYQVEGNERFARLLHSLNHQKGMDNSIPNKISFLEMMKVKQAEELPIIDNWNTNQSSKTLAVPIGLKNKKDAVMLNLHEKAHGPHGLVAGTTGSGKSELLQTFILSLAVHFHPHEAAFLLIDYKGGGMAQPFKRMPHLLGTITNIEGSRNFSKRALASLNSELKRRQRLFDRYAVNHINDYTNLYKAGETEEPLPHLFIISDEFAELKSEEPEFIRELVSAARIGRSLGVHLILATQKPGGIIDDQIWSNARFRLALKVQDASDSKEILKNGDAANITETGRGILQVGNNEVYELFQSAWSGAPYLEDSIESESEISLVTDLGLIPLSTIAADHVQNKELQMTEMEAVVSEIVKSQKILDVQSLSSPWLPPLPERIGGTAKLIRSEDRFAIGLKDEPEQQSQTPYSYQWLEDGNIGIFGSSGYGKSMTVMSLLLHFAAHHTPEQLHYYIFDFGNSALLPLRQLPHTGDYFRYDDIRKIEKFMRRMRQEIERRKELFLEAEVSSIKLYNQVSAEKLPVIFITVDNFDAVKEEMQEIDLQMTQFARDGQSLGIFMIFTATRIQSVRQPLMNNLKTKVVHYLMDSTETYTLIGKPPYEIEPIPGRALIKKEKAYLTQIYLPAEGKDDLDINQQIKMEIKERQELYKNMKLPESVPMLPSNLSLESFHHSYMTTKKTGQLPIGLEEEFVTPVFIDLTSGSHCLVIGQSRKGKTNALKVMMESLLNQETAGIAVSDGIDRGLSAYARKDGVSYLETKEHLISWMDEAERLLSEREQLYVQSIREQNRDPLSFNPMVLVIDSLSRYQQASDSILLDRTARLMKQYSHLGFRIIVAANASELMKGFDALTNEVKQVRQALILMKKSEQSLFTLPFTRKEGEVQPGFGYLVVNGQEHKIQIPLC